MPSFCRHNRLESSCPICSRKRREAEQAAAAAARPPKRAATRSASSTPRAGGAPRRRAGGDVVVRRLARAADDGYSSELVPGLHASADAALLAQELAFAATRLAELERTPPGTFAAAAALARDGRREEGLWLAMQIAAIGPREPWQARQPAGESGGTPAGAEGAGDYGGSPAGEERAGANGASAATGQPAAFDPFAAIDEAAVPWAEDVLPAVAQELLGPRASSDLPATLRGYRDWAARSRGQAAGLAGDASWSAERRFDRAFERLALPGFARGVRFDFLLTAGALGLADLRPASLQFLAGPRDPVVAAAKRAFGFGDPIVLARRASDLAATTGLPLGALDLGLLNWSRLADDPGAGRIAAGSAAAPDEDVRAYVLDALGVDAPEPAAE